MKLFQRAIIIALFNFVFSIVLTAQIGLGNKLQVDHVSVYTTQPGPDGQRRLSVSFRVINNSVGSIVVPQPIIATVTFAGNAVNLSVPPLRSQASAFVSTSIETTAAQVPLTIDVKETSIATQSRSQTGREHRVQSHVINIVVQPGLDYGRWQSIGPSRITMSPNATGRVTTIAVDPRSPNTVYAGARGSGLWKSSGSNMIWFPISDSLPTAEIDSVALDPSKPDHVVISTPAGVFQSVNGGSVWTQLAANDIHASGSDGASFLIARSLNPPMYASTSTGVQVSIDGGFTWKNVLGNGSPSVSLQFETSDATRLLASTANPTPAVFEGTNGGLTATSWHQLHGCSTAPLPTFPKTSNVWISESGGQMWVSFRAGAADNDQLGLWRTTSATCIVNGWPEHGWQQVSLPNPCDQFVNHWSYLYAHPTDSRIIFKGGIGLCRSTSSGDGMAQVSNIHADHHAIAIAPSVPSTIYFGSDGGIYRSTDNGANLTFVGEGMNNTEFLKIDVDNQNFPVVGGSQDNGTETWDGTSPVWNYVSGTGDSSIVAFNRADQGSVYEIGQSTRQIARRQFGGSSQSLGDGSMPDCCSYQEFPALVLEGMVSTGGNPAIGLTCHGIWSGPPWKQIQPPLGQTPPPSGCDFSNTGDFTRLKFTTGGLGTWVGVTNTGHVFYGIYAQPPPADVFHTSTPKSPSAISFVNQSTFYIAFTDGSIVRLQCFAGCEAESVWTHNPSVEITAISIDPLAADTLLAAVRDQGVFHGTRDSTGTWTWIPYNNGLPFAVTVTDLEARANGSVVAATYGRGAFVLFSRPLGPPQLTARGHVTLFTAERVDPNRPPGPNNPLIATAELDSKPGFIFSSNSLANGVGILQAALANHRTVVIVYTANGQNGGKITSARYG